MDTTAETSAGSKSPDGMAPDEELRILRARAYGPDADLQGDVAALARLTELEGIVRSARRSRDGDLHRPVRLPGESAPPTDSVAAPPAAASTSAAAIALEASPASGAAARPVVPSTASDGADQSEAVGHALVVDAARERSRWRLPLLWAASLVVAILVTVAVSRAIIQRVQVDPQNVGATQVARLGMDAGLELPSYFSNNAQAVARGSEDFYGLRAVLSTSGFFNGQTDTQCISVARFEDFETASDNSYNGPIFYGGCAANAFPATVSITVTAEMPDELRDIYPDGTALQFVYDESGSDVVVFGSPE